MALVDAIKTLHTSTIDTRRAYAKARDETDEEALKTLFGSMVDLRGKAHDELHRVLVEMGETPDEDGSFMSTVHKTVIAVRSAIKGVDHSALQAFADGEENIVREYDDALRQEDVHERTSRLLNGQKAALLDKIAEMKALAR